MERHYQRHEGYAVDDMARSVRLDDVGGPGLTASVVVNGEGQSNLWIGVDGQGATPGWDVVPNHERTGRLPDHMQYRLNCVMARPTGFERDRCGALRPNGQRCCNRTMGGHCHLHRGATTP